MPVPEADERFLMHIRHIKIRRISLSTYISPEKPKRDIFFNIFFEGGDFRKAAAMFSPCAKESTPPPGRRALLSDGNFPSGAKEKW